MADINTEILLVEDNTLDQELVTGILSQNGLAGKVCSVHSGQAALKLIFGKKTGSNGLHTVDLPKLILLGLNPPRADCSEVLQVVKRDASTELIPVVVMSSSKDKDAMPCIAAIEKGPTVAFKSLRVLPSTRSYWR